MILLSAVKVREQKVSKNRTNTFYGCWFAFIFRIRCWRFLIEHSFDAPECFANINEHLIFTFDISPSFAQENLENTREWFWYVDTVLASMCKVFIHWQNINQFGHFHCSYWGKFLEGNNIAGTIVYLIAGDILREKLI